jgi:ADP-heptose:LPS heptosyltransferase
MDMYVCPSTGPLHVASSVGTTTVSPFCPRVPLCATIWGNVGSLAQVIEPATCPRKGNAGPCCDFHGQITSSQIFHEVIDLLRSPATRSSRSRSRA